VRLPSQSPWSVKVKTLSYTSQCRVPCTLVSAPWLAMPDSSNRLCRITTRELLSGSRTCSGISRKTLSST